jgi:hypothetical protein
MKTEDFIEKFKRKLTYPKKSWEKSTDVGFF